MEISIYSQHWRRAWDHHVKSSVNGSIFQQRQFLAYHPPDRFNDQSLIFHKGNSIMAVFPAAITSNQEGLTSLISHPGSSYGGIIIKKGLGLDKINQIIKQLLEKAKEMRVNEIMIRLPPPIYNAVPCDEIPFMLRHHGFAELYSELSTCYPLSFLQQNHGKQVNDLLLDSFTGRARTSLRKALKHQLITKWIETPEELATFYSILETNLQKHKATPTHSLEEMLDLKNRFPEAIRILAVHQENTLIGGLTVFKANLHVAHIFYSACQPDKLHLQPLYLAIFDLLLWASKEKLSYLNYGISTEAKGTVINWGLYKYKESFGGTGTMRSAWQKTLS